jgi:hypothetical protein
MQHEVTIICDDIRAETGHKYSLMGLYDEAIVVESVPGRIAKLCMYQRWAEVTKFPSSFRVEIKGSALGGKIFNVEPLPADVKDYDPARTKAQLMVVVAPLDLITAGEIQFLTYVEHKTQPTYSHKLEVRIGKVT